MSQNNQSEQQPTSVSLVGNLLLSSTEDVFWTLCAAFPNHLRHILDGEPGTRYNGIWWRRESFASPPNILREPVAVGAMYSASHQHMSAQKSNLNLS